MSGRPSALPLQAYYAATVLFLAADLAFGFTARAAFFADSPVLRGGWYLLCAACFGLIAWRPQWAAAVATLESAAALALLILTTALRVVIVTDDMVEAGRVPVTGMEIVNFLLCGCVGWYALQQSLNALRR